MTQVTSPRDVKFNAGAGTYHAITEDAEYESVCRTVEALVASAPDLADVDVDPVEEYLEPEQVAGVLSAADYDFDDGVEFSLPDYDLALYPTGEVILTPDARG